MATPRISLRDQVLLAAAECCGGEPAVEFSAEDLLLAAWQADPASWGLRGHENEHPNSERIYTELDRANVKGGMVGLGLLEKVGKRVYRLSPSGFARVAELDPINERHRGQQQRAHRAVEAAMREILGHQTFMGWLKDPQHPKRFRDACHFWNIAPGTPADVVVTRVRRAEQTLEGALQLLERTGTAGIAAGSGTGQYEREDIERCVAFQAELRVRFNKELVAMGGEKLDWQGRTPA